MPLATAISGALAAGVAPTLSLAQTDSGDAELETIVVTATRRELNVQEIPFNIAAVSGDAIAEGGISNLVDLSRTVPGLYVVDQGARAANRIVVRGLNASTVDSTDNLGNSGGDTVQTYIGEIPVYWDLKLEDLERVEVLLGPQGTLYGAGTMGGAVRYIPKRPAFNTTSVSLRGEGYTLAESDGIGAKGGFTFNLPFSEVLAVRASVDYLHDPGFIDYNYLVREPGVSDPEPDFSNPSAVAANLWRKKDANDEKTLSGRVGLRWAVTDAVDANLTYYFQDQKVGARTVAHRAAFGTGPYESADRYLEPNERKNQLLALEITADLGFAELTSATGTTKYKEHGQRDQTDLLITLEYSYEAFPSFSAFTREDEEDKSFNQELRLVSKTKGPLNWIAGAFYNHRDTEAASKEFTPGYSEFLVEQYGGTVRPDSLEYYSLEKNKTKETALYGELGYQITDQWQVTVGGRWYKYEVDTSAGYTTPLWLTFLDEIGPDEIPLDLKHYGLSDNGTLFKFNTSYRFTDELMTYFTVSEGYRYGNSNLIAPCEDPLPTGQNVCALPDELLFQSDKTINYEVGLRSRWFENRLKLNGSIFFIDWKDPQLDGVTVNGSLPITRNGKGAESRGVELSFDALIIPRLTLHGAYSYSRAKLSEDAPALLRTYVPPGFGTAEVDGKAGDRLPGSPEHRGNLFANYDIPVGQGWNLGLRYGFTAQSNMLTSTGGRAGGETLGGYTVHNASATLSANRWSTSLYVNNLFNKYAETGVRGTSLLVQTVSDMNGDPVRVRAYYKDVLRPRQIGIRFTYDFDL